MSRNKFSDRQSWVFAGRLAMAGYGEYEGEFGRERGHEHHKHHESEREERREERREECEEREERREERREEGYERRHEGYGDRPSGYGDRPSGYGDRPSYDNQGYGEQDHHGYSKSSLRKDEVSFDTSTLAVDLFLEVPQL